MKTLSKNFSVYKFLFFAGVFSAFNLSVPAQFSSTAYIGQGDTDTRQRVVETDKKAISINAKAAFSAIDLEKLAFDLLNEKRAAKNLPALQWDEDVAKIARMHSENMAKYKFFSHTGLDGTMVNDRADLCGVSRWKAIGENIAFNRGYDKPADFAVERWMNSISHRENILNDRWKQSAVGVAVADDGSYYFTQVFLARK
jgi:uncharacterized protein YkwD